MPLPTLRKFLQLESAGGIVLLLSAMIALVLDNSVSAPYYDHFRAAALHIPFGFFSLRLSTMGIVNDGLMTIFFLLIGLELKREWAYGELSDRKKVLLPALAALGGMLVPALIYFLLNRHQPHALAGWPIPVATDIAFALGVLSLFGRKIPLGLKLFLMLLAIFDDLGAVIIIAIFFSGTISPIACGLTAVVILMLCEMARRSVRSLWLWSTAGLLLWGAFFYLGVHPVVAGVLLGLIMPADSETRFEKILHPWVVFVIMPLFALMNAGVHLGWNGLDHAVVLGVVAGLLLGKPLGVLLTSFLCIRARWAKLPAHTSWHLFVGVAFLCGIGFTMSLFLGTLAFPAGSDSVRLAVLVGSMASGLVGSFILLIKKGK
ncbi:MAG: Na+/H+ antiporter NhaA [Gammaproteobacteria bacterium]|nr:Na+/H+ antiporter NhaA [Gammaproteobacteria bacterium]